jgi:hypothetical protein
MTKMTPTARFTVESSILAIRPTATRAPRPASKPHNSPAFQPESGSCPYAAHCRRMRDIGKKARKWPLFGQILACEQ